MNLEQFEKVVDGRLQRIVSILKRKADEYARGDRLSNFKRAAKILGSSPERALLGMMAKDWVSVLDLIEDLDRGVLAPQWMWEEKIGDAINYLILLEAMGSERHQWIMSQGDSGIEAQPKKHRK